MNLRLWLLPILLLSVLAVRAEVYKWVDEHGNVHYSDLPPAGVPADPVKLPGLSTYAIPSQGTTSPPGGSAANGRFTGYTRVAITQPEPNGVVRTNEQKVAVQVDLQPPLQEGHAIVVLLDGSAVGGPYTGTAVELSGVNRGQHRLQVRVVDANGKVLGESASITFTLRQAGLEATPGEPPSNGDGSYKPGYTPAKDQGKDYTPAKDQGEEYTPPKGTPPYVPPADPGGDYQPANGQPPHNPGTSAPGFAPKFTP